MLEKVNRLLEHKNGLLEYAASHVSLTIFPERTALTGSLDRKVKKTKSNSPLYGASKGFLPKMLATLFKRRNKFALCFIDIDKF